MPRRLRTRIACSPLDAWSDGDRARERARQQAALAGRQLRAQVDDLDGRRLTHRPRRQDDPVVVAGARPADALDRGRRGPEHDRRTGQAGQPDRRVACLEPRRAVALVGRVVLLVDHDQPDVRQRREDRQPRPDDDVDLARPDASPLVGPLPVAEAGMDERDPRVEVRPEPIDQRQRERDLRDEDERRPAGLERRGDGLDIDGGLAAAGDPVEQQRTRIARRDRGADPLDRLGLGGQQVARRRPAAAPTRRARRQRPPRSLADLGLDQAAADETGDGAAAVVAGQVRGRLPIGRAGGQLAQRVGLARAERPPRPRRRSPRSAATAAATASRPASVRRTHRS